MHVFDTIYQVARYTVAALFVLSLLIAVGYWAARRGKINAFGWLARGIRRIADPVMHPVERRVIRIGGNPQDAPIWLVGIVGVLGLLLLGFIKWLIGIALYVSALSHGGPREWLRFLVDTIYFILVVALMVRVFGSWVGMGRYNRWMRGAYRLTDWFVEPFRRMLPPFGFVDISPLLAWLALWLVHTLLIKLLLPPLS
jgi:YggT family protein